MLENMPSGCVDGAAWWRDPPRVLGMEAIFETTEIAGKNMMDLVFSQTTLGSDALSTVEVAVGSVIGAGFR